MIILKEVDYIVIHFEIPEQLLHKHIDLLITLNVYEHFTTILINNLVLVVHHVGQILQCLNSVIYVDTLSELTLVSLHPQRRLFKLNIQFSQLL